MPARLPPARISHFRSLAGHGLSWMALALAAASSPCSAQSPPVAVPAEWVGSDPQDETSPLSDDTLDELFFAMTARPPEERLAVAEDIIARLAYRLQQPQGKLPFGFFKYQLLDALAQNGGSMEWVARATARIDAQIAMFRKSGNARGELWLFDLRQEGNPPGEALASKRAVHRRAAELGLLDSDVARLTRSSMADYARSYIETGREEEALIAMRDTMAEMAQVPEISIDPLFLRAYAETLIMNARFDEADALFAKLQAFWASGEGEAARPKDAQYNLWLNDNQQAYFHNIKGQFARALEPGKRAAETAPKLFGPTEISTQKARYNYAAALLGQGQAAQALPYFEEALPLQLAAEKDGFRGRRTDTIILLTTLARARAQVAGHEVEALEAASEAAERLRTQRKERLRGGQASEKSDPGLTALSRAMTGNERRNPLSTAFDSVLQAGWAARKQVPGALDAAFLAAQDLVLSDAGEAISQAAARNLAGDGPLGEIVRRRQDAANALTAGSQQLRRDALGNDPARTEKLRAQLQALGTEIAELDARLEREFPEYSDLILPGAIDVATVRKALGKDEALLFLLPSDGHVHLFAITSDRQGWHRLDNGAATVASQVARLKCRLDEMTCSADERFAILQEEDQSAPDPIDDYYPRYDAQAAYGLYRNLLEPVEAMLRGKRTVYVVSSGPVSGLPLATLLTRPLRRIDTAARLKSAPWLGNRHAFVTLPSVSALTVPRGRIAGGTARGRFIGYGAPSLDGNPEAVAARGAAAQGRRRVRGLAPVRAAGFFTLSSDGAAMQVDPGLLRKLDPLPGTATELQSLAQALGEANSAVHLGNAATETAVKQDASLAKADVLVFATHGLLPGEMGQSAEPGLVLTPPMTASPLDDGLLTASEAAALDLGARWVILSACNTATADSAPGSDALSGLARSFLYSGAQSLLASHWRVADDASAALTVETVTAGGLGLKQAQALQASQRAIRSGTSTTGRKIAEWKPHWAHPSAWAPFTLITDRNR